MGAGAHRSRGTAYVLPTVWAQGRTGRAIGNAGIGTTMQPRSGFQKGLDQVGFPTPAPDRLSVGDLIDTNKWSGRCSGKGSYRSPVATLVLRNET